MKAWFKDGLIGVGIMSSINIVAVILATLFKGFISNIGETIFLIELIVIGSPLFFLGLKYHNASIEVLIITFLYFALVFFLISVLIGWIIRKIKSKKQQPVQTQPQIQSK